MLALSQEESLVPEEEISTIESQDSFANEILLQKLKEHNIEKLQEIQNSEAVINTTQNEDITDTGQNENITDAGQNENITIIDAEPLDSFNYVHYNWNTVPRLICEASGEYESSESCENFTKGCQWSPDGTCLLVPSEDFKIRIYELPRELYSAKIHSESKPMNFPVALTIKEGGLIYDTCWYPFMNSWEPATCCFLSTSRESPIHLWDAFNGELRATYRAYNQVDEVEASISVQFIDSAREIWAGFKNTLRVFNVERPGRQINTIQFKKDFPNATGLVSCIRENPIMPGLVAFGTYSKYIGLYRDGPLCSFKTGSGVTQIEFSPCGTKLFSVVRKNSEFLCWDLRNPGIVLYSLQGRQSNTNQRIQFSVISDGKQIISGGTDGNVALWELQQSTDYTDFNVMYKIKLSHDCINGVCLHRSLPIIATSTGQRLCGNTIQDRDNNVRLWCVS